MFSLLQATALSMGNNHEYDMAVKVEKVCTNYDYYFVPINYSKLI